jgi:hypothetical protein
MRKLFLIFISLHLNLVFANSFCSNYKKSQSYIDFQKTVNERIEIFSNNKVIAEKADTVLSKLISAKSPYVTAWYAKNDFKNKTEAQILQAWRSDFAMNFLLMKYPQGEEKVDVEIEKLIDGILKEKLTLAYQVKLEKLFSTSKQLAIETILEMKFKESPEIIKKIEAIKLYWPKKLKESRNNPMPLDLIEWGIAYDPVPNEINIGLASLSYPNDETYLAVFSHEIGHAFDSCRWGAFFQGTWPFEKVGECLRSDKSAGAKKRDDSKLDELLKSGKISASLAASLKENPTCNKFIYPPRGIQADQLPESFADWFSAEVISHAQNIDVKKVRLDLCEVKVLSEGSSYPNNQTRQDKIYFSNPKIKALSHDQSGDSYCALK